MAYNGKEAIEVVQQLHSESISPSLILMDLEMPVMDGIEATKVLIKKMQDKEVAEIPIVGLSANDSEIIMKSCLDAVMSKYCRKPLMDKDLLDLLKEYGLISEESNS